MIIYIGGHKIITAVRWIQRTPKVKTLRTEPCSEKTREKGEGAIEITQSGRVLVTKSDNRV